MIWFYHLHHKIEILTVKYRGLNSQKLFQDQKRCPPTISLLFKAFRILLINLYMALFVEESDLNPKLFLC